MMERSPGNGEGTGDCEVCVGLHLRELEVEKIVHLNLYRDLEEQFRVEAQPLLGEMTKILERELIQAYLSSMMSALWKQGKL